jgi:hypothetical protein
MDVRVNELTPLRLLSGAEPVVIAPTGGKYWHTCKRLSRCEVYALPEADEVFSVWFWFQMLDRDVTMWPADIRSSHIMTLIMQELLRHQPMFKALRWAWGVPWASELGEPEALIETVWRREPHVRKAVAA